MTRHLLLEISGMHCGSCEKLISEELKDLPGVGAVKISAVNGSGDVEITDEVSEEQVIEAIKIAGYQATVTKKFKPQKNQNLMNWISL